MQTENITCSEQINQINPLPTFFTNTQWHAGKAALGWNTVLAPFVALVKTYVTQNDEDVNSLENRVAQLESQLAKALESLTPTVTSSVKKGTSSKE